MVIKSHFQKGSTSESLRIKVDDMHEGRIILLCLWLLGMVFHVGESGEVRLTQETPCLTGQSTRLKCSVTSGTNVNGLVFHQDGTLIVSCTSPLSCAVFTGVNIYKLTMEGVSTSYLDIPTCDNEFIGTGTWTCSDGENGKNSRVRVIVNILPTGPLTWGSSCVSGGVTRPASLSCSGLNPGVPPADLSITDTSRQVVGSSQTGSVVGTVTRVGQASCSVTWPAFPSFSLNISPVQCLVEGPPLPPENLRGIPDVDSATLSWEPGFPGGDYYQWFHLQYRGPGADWTNHSAGNNRSSSDGRTANQTVTGLQPHTTYEFRVQAQSTRPKDNLSPFISVSVKTLTQNSVLLYILWGVLGAAGLLIVITLGVYIVRRCQKSQDEQRKGEGPSAKTEGK